MEASCVGRGGNIGGNEDKCDCVVSVWCRLHRQDLCIKVVLELDLSVWRWMSAHVLAYGVRAVDGVEDAVEDGVEDGVGVVCSGQWSDAELGKVFVHMVIVTSWMR